MKWIFAYFEKQSPSECFHNITDNVVRSLFVARMEMPATKGLWGRVRI